ncbi:hypothetical protein MRX96_014341 [Rhipicephalus microplus]
MSHKRRGEKEAVPARAFPDPRVPGSSGFAFRDRHLRRPALSPKTAESSARLHAFPRSDEAQGETRAPPEGHPERGTSANAHRNRRHPRSRGTKGGRQLG